VVFVYQDKQLRGAQPLDHRTVVRIVQEVAPSDAIEKLSQSGKADFVFQAGAHKARMQLEALDKARWRVTLTVGNQAAQAAAPSPSEEDGLVLQTSGGRSVPPPGAGGGSQPSVPAAAGVPAIAESSPSLSVSPPAQAGASSGEEFRASGGGTEPKVFALLRLLVKRKGSDLHLSSGVVPMMRVHGEMVPADPKYPVMTDAMMRPLLGEIWTQKAKEDFEKLNDADFAVSIPGVARFRANYFMDRRGMGAVFRQIPYEIVPPEKLGIPPIVMDLCNLTKGIVLVTGPTGSGKSTTLAALVDVCNQRRSDHIITIEDPVEFVHENKKCLVNQREVGTHTGGFKNALRAALREDPDIVLVGEMRDLETVAIAIETAETGHLVFGTLHTNTAPSTVNRIIDQFPADRQEQIRLMLSESLRAVIAQVLCKKIGGGRVAAYEILIATSAVAALIREGKTTQLVSVMQTGRGIGMQTLNDHLLMLVKTGQVEAKEAYMKAVEKNALLDAFNKNGIEFKPG